MTRDLFEDWATWFVVQVGRIGFGKQFANPLILLLDGHTSRWTYKGLKTLIDAGVFPFFIGSHTSAWHQPNDNGLNASYKSEFRKAVKRWRLANPYGVFDRVAFNKCAVEAWHAVQIKCKAEMARWTAKQLAWQDLGSPEGLKPKGKVGNVVTRAWKKRAGGHS